MKLIAFLTSIAIFGSFSVAHAQKKDAKRASRIIRIDSVKVEGRIQKPEAFYILQRSELNFEGLEPKKSFVPLIIKSVDKEPF
tara:strand:- start:288 stop:536 length:249 start_codon:yes stop_codon:yes gene_type:complete